MKRRKSKKIDKIHSPVDLHSRIEVWHDMDKGRPVHPNAPEPLEPSELTRVQQIQLIEYLKFCKALSNREIADFLKIHRITVAKRLDELEEQQALELQEKGFNVWGVIHRLKMTVEYVKKQARIKDDPDLYLRAVTTYINQCQKLGVIYEKPLEANVNVYPKHSLEDEKLIIEHLRAEHQRTLEAIKVAEREKAGSTELAQEVKEN